MNRFPEDINSHPDKRREIYKTLIIQRLRKKLYVFFLGLRTAQMADEYYDLNIVFNITNLDKNEKKEIIQRVRDDLEEMKIKTRLVCGGTGLSMIEP